jgi:hypothetical protein
MDTWEYIQQIRVGASQCVCDRCSSINHPYHYDDRPYGTALQQEGYPLIARWCLGHWTNETLAECLLLMKTAIGHRSRPMLGVALAALADAPQEVKHRLWSQLNQAEQNTARQLIAIGANL